MSRVILTDDVFYSVRGAVLFCFSCQRFYLSQVLAIELSFGVWVVGLKYWPREMGDVFMVFSLFA